MLFRSLEDYFDEEKTIIVTTHQVEEIQEVLTDVVFIDRGRVALTTSMAAFQERYVEAMIRPENAEAARALGPLHERQVFGRPIMLFDGADRARLAELGEVRTPGLADLFVAVMGPEGVAARRAAA